MQKAKTQQTRNIFPILNMNINSSQRSLPLQSLPTYILLTWPKGMDDGSNGCESIIKSHTTLFALCMGACVCALVWTGRKTLNAYKGTKISKKLSVLLVLLLVTKTGYFWSGQLGRVGLSLTLCQFWTELWYFVYCL